MLTEAIHSSTDTINQVLLLVGNKRSRARPDASHAFGYGMEVYFWTFVVAVIVLLAGGVASIYEGVRQLASPQPLESPLVNFAVLVLSAIFEGTSLAVAYRAYRRQVRGRVRSEQPGAMWRFIKASKDPNMYETLLEDSAALIGIGLAAVGVIGSAYLGALWADGAASIAIGLLLVANSLVIAEATRSLIAGETASAPVLEDIHRALPAGSRQFAFSEVKTLHLGPKTILVALTFAKGQKGSSAVTPRELHDLTKRLRAVDRRIAFVYFRFD
jgi:cation diffusion facilitator family transporter